MSSSLIFIEEYRGWNIYFSIPKESFVCQLDEQQKDKQSYTAAKKYVDGYIEENKDFKPFEVTLIPNGYSSFVGKNAKIIGQRKDGAYIIESSNGETNQLSKYDEDKWILRVEENETLYNEYEKLEKELSEIRTHYSKELGNIFRQFKITSVKEYRRNLEKK